MGTQTKAQQPWPGDACHDSNTIQRDLGPAQVNRAWGMRNARDVPGWADGVGMGCPVAECQLPKLDVAGSNPVARST